MQGRWWGNGLVEGENEPRQKSCSLAVTHLLGLPLLGAPCCSSHLVPPPCVAELPTSLLRGKGHMWMVFRGWACVGVARVKVEMVGGETKPTSTISMVD